MDPVKAPTSDRRDLAGRLAGALGLLCLFALPMAYFAVGGTFYTVFVVQAAVGVAGIVAWVVLRPGALGRMAKGRGALYTGMTGITALAVVAGAVALNVLAARAGVAVDLTRPGLFTLSEDSQSIAGALDAPVELVAFYPGDTTEAQVLVELTHLYRRHTDQLSLTLVDPAKDPTRAERFGIRLGGRRIALVQGERVEKLEAATEEAITNGLVRLTGAEPQGVYFTIGHGEASLEDAKTPRGLDQLAKALSDDGLAPRSLELTRALPEDVGIVVVAGPRTPFLAAEVEALRAFLARGGRAVLLLDPAVDAGLDALLEDWAIQLDDTLAIDPEGPEQLGAAVPIVRSYSKHPITDGFDLATVLPTARTLTSLNLEGLPRPLPLAMTAPSAWAETDYVGADFQLGDGEKRGRLPLALVAEHAVGDHPARLVVFGDSDFVGRQWLGQLGNKDFFLNVLGWMTERPERITIRARRRGRSSLFLTARQMTVLRLVSVDGVPLVIAILGLGIWVRRRSR